HPFLRFADRANKNNRSDRRSRQQQADNGFKQLPGACGPWRGVHSTRHGRHGLPYGRGSHACACGGQRKVGRYVSLWTRYTQQKLNRALYSWRFTVGLSRPTPVLSAAFYGRRRMRMLLICPEATTEIPTSRE